MIRDDTDKLLILLSFGLIIYVYFKTHKSSLLPLPPGPRKLPLLANLLDLPTTHQWLKFIEWGKEFSMFLVIHLPSSKLIGLEWIDSNIIHIHAAGKDFIIVNSFEVAIELGDRRSAIYSSRCVLITPGTYTVLIPLQSNIADVH